MNFNWIDIVVLAVVIYTIWEGWEDGMFKLLAELLVFLGSLGAAILFHMNVGTFLSDKFGIPVIWSEVVGYVSVAIIADLVLVNIASYFVRMVPKKWYLSKWNRLLGGFASSAKGLILMAFLFMVVLALPLRGTVKQDIKSSLIGSKLTVFGKNYSTNVMTSFVTIKPESNERVDLNLNGEKCEYKVDPVSEATMLGLLNQERIKLGLAEIKTDSAIAEVSRRHSLDMFIREYFSHVSPEGDTAAERLDQAKIVFMVAGENLAYAPDVMAAHKGLMESEGHRKNILDKRYRKVGIGVINGGKCGMMFTQVFSD